MSGPLPRRVVVALLVSFSACGGEGKSLGQNAACTSSADCAVGLICDGGQCRTACNVDIDCPVGNHCAFGLCVPLPKGVCAQAGDCVTPPDACHIIAGATCDDGSCTYQAKSDPLCGATCNDDSMCDPLAHDLDRCSTGSCVNHLCAFAAVPSCPYVPLATTCTSDNDCASGHCADGMCCDSACDDVCEQCTDGTGRCDTKPDDDSACGLITCDGLDNICRDYSNLTSATQHRCAGLARCAEDNNPDDCVVYVNASNNTVCRASGGPCDVDDKCSGGVCGTDGKVASGGQCIGNDADDDPGVCDDAQNCWQLTTLGNAQRYFIEETSAASNRVDDFGMHNLTAGYNNDVSEQADTMGRGVSWNTTSATSTYCANGGASVLSASTKIATLEVDFTPSLGTYTNEWIAGAGSNALDLFGLSISHTSTDATATINGWVNGNNVSYSIDPSPSRIVLHLVFDSTQATNATRLRLFVNGTSAIGTGAFPNQGDTISASSGHICIGNTVSTPHSAVTGTLWYAAFYDGTPSDPQIDAAAARLQLSDKP